MNDFNDNNEIIVFISYSHEDLPWLERLKVHLAALKYIDNKNINIDVWEDTRLRPGTKWREEIQVAIEKSNVAILIISADFLASEFIRENELPPLLKAAEEEGALILPIISSPSLVLRYQDIAQFQFVNNPATCLVSLSKGEQEDIFVKVAEAILDKSSDVHKKNDAIINIESHLRSESFLESRNWVKLIKIGDWIFDGEVHQITGSGMHAYLISREEYGNVVFDIKTKLKFSNFQKYLDRPMAKMNAGIILGWNSDHSNPRYYNILISGLDLCIERIGFKGGDDFRDFEHMTKPIPFEIESGKWYDFDIHVDHKSINISIDGNRVINILRPTGIVGRVGLRPWRSKLDCSNFIVSDSIPASK